MNSYDLSGRRAVVTGGGSGIGMAVARKFLQSGAAVEIWGRSLDRLEAAAEELRPLGRLELASVDVSDWEQVQAGAASAQARGDVDILFNCAGLSMAVKPLLEMEVDIWRANIGVNLHSAFYCCKALAPAMVSRGWGRIINTSSMAGKEGLPNMSAYSSAKAGIIGLTKSLGKELAQTGVLVNAICPTVFDTPLVRETMERAPKEMAASLARNPMGRMGRTEEAANMVAWLASDDCSFNAGVTFDLSGGRAVY